jgi:RNA polymerase sigma factor (sigma-70 family)
MLPEFGGRMAISQANAVVQYLNVGLPSDQPTDKQLLEGFVARRDVLALATLIQRHAQMVWGVCRRILHSHHDAEDAFQATFLVLVRKAASIVPAEMVANWLYGVAHQTALKARATTAKRAERERQVTEMPEPTVTDRDVWSDLQPLLDEELIRLPDKYRSVVVLCELEGKSRKEVAAQLGVPEGTVSGRLARALVMLAKRLTKRGVALSGGAMATALARNSASANVPAAVLSSTLEVAKQVAMGQAIASASSAKVAALTEGVLKTMLTAKLKQSLFVVLVLIGSVAACGLLYKSSATEPFPTSPAQNDSPSGKPSTSKPNAQAVEKDDQSGLPVGQYTGACQVMEIAQNGTVSYPDAPPPAICHIEIKTNGELIVEFPDKKLGRGQWDAITLKLAASEPRARWNAMHNGDTYQVTAIPYGVGAYIFRLEIFTKGKLVAGAQQFYALPVESGVGQAKKRRVYQVGDAEVTKMLRDPGSRFDVAVIGKVNGGVSGTDVYFFDSDLDTAAVHAGLVKNGEMGVVTVTVVKCPKSEPGSTRNGVKSLPWDAARPGDTAFILQHQDKADKPLEGEPKVAKNRDGQAILTIEDAVNRTPSEEVTLEFKVAKVVLGWNTSDGEDRVLYMIPADKHKDVVGFTVMIHGNAATAVLDARGAFRRTDPNKPMFSGNVFRVTGKIGLLQNPQQEACYGIAVSNPDKIKMVK